MTICLHTKNDALKNKETNERHAIGCPKVILADSLSEINGFKRPRECPGGSQTQFRQIVPTKSMIFRGEGHLAPGEKPAGPSVQGGEEGRF